MKLLFFSSTFPYPLNEGIKTPVYNLIKEFSKYFEVYLLSFILPEEKIYVEEMEKFCTDIITLEFTPTKSYIKRAFNTFFSNIPFNIEQFFCAKMKEKFVEIVEKQNFDILFFDFFTTAIYVKFITKPITKIFHYHDSMSINFYRNYLVSKNIIEKIYWYKQYKKVLNFEKNLHFLFDKITVVAKKDKNWILEKTRVSKDKIEVIPNGIDLGYFKFYSEDEKQKIREKLKIRTPSLIFRGIMSFKPNIDSCLWFIKNVFPLLKQKIENIKLYIVGPNPSREILKYVSDNVIVTGYVEDLREYMVACDINICPMISGSGIKNKILEALALGVPTVATPIATEGIPELEDNKNILVASTPQQFVEKILLLLENKNLYNIIVQNGRKLIAENYTWEKQTKKFINIFEELNKEYEVKKISIIIPAYNEEKTIKQVIKRVSNIEFGIDKEIIVINDGSEDNTAEKVNELIKDGYNIKLISHIKNSGKGCAIRTGIANSTGEIIVIQDADLEYEPSELKTLIQPIIDKKTFVVYGSRFLKKNPVLYKTYYLGNKFMSFVISFLFGQQITDPYTCYKILHKKIFEKMNLESKKFEFEAEITCKLLKNGYKILEIPISYNPRSLKQGKKIKFKDAVVGLLTILKIKFFG